MALLSSASVLLVLITSQGGTHGWTSPLILGQSAALLVLIALFIVVERRASSPVLPGHLFKNRQVLLATLAGILVGVTMFSTISYLPTFFQLVNGATAVGSGLMMIPMTLGNVFGSMGSGSLVSKTGRYKIFLITGPILTLGGLGLLGTMTAGTAYLQAASGMFLVGIGIGVMMQNLVVIVQAQVERKDLGVATSATNYFRMIGASVGIAVFGSIFVSSFSAKIAGSGIEIAPGGEGGLGSLTPEFVHSLPAGSQALIADAMAGSMPQIFVISMFLAAGALVISLMIKETPLATTRG